jgi:hypothetical protein
MWFSFVNQYSDVEEDVCVITANKENTLGNNNGK